MLDDLWKIIGAVIGNDDDGIHVRQDLRLHWHLLLGKLVLPRRFQLRYPGVVIGNIRPLFHQ